MKKLIFGLIILLISLSKINAQDLQQCSNDRDCKVGGRQCMGGGATWSGVCTANPAVSCKSTSECLLNQKCYGAIEGRLGVCAYKKMRE